MQYRKSGTWAGVLMVILTMVLTACGDENTNSITIDNRQPGGATIAITSATLSAGEIFLGTCGAQSATVTVVTSPANQVYTTTSLNPSVATVDASGVIRGLASGKATIRVTISGTNVYVDKEVTVSLCQSNGTPSINFTPHGGSYAVGTQVQLTSTCANITCLNPLWSSNHPEIATVVSTSPGKATLTCIVPGTARISVVVQNATISANNPSDFADFVCVGQTGSGITGVSIMPNGSTVTLTGTNGVCTSQTIQFTATVSPVTASQGVTWSGSNISSNGILTVTAPGDYTVTARSNADNAVVGTSVLHVVGNCGTPSSGNVTASPATFTITNCSGYNATYTPTITYNNGSVSGTSWTSSNTGVATTTSNGFTLTGTAGTTTITVVTPQGTVTIPVTVTQCTNNQPSTGTLLPTGVQTIGSGQSCTNTSVIFTSDLPITNVSVSPTGIAAVATFASNQLKVISISGQSGQVIITATVSGGTRTATVNVSNASCAQGSNVSAVTVTPPSATMILGKIQDFTATVVGVAGVSQCVTWTTSNPTRVVLSNTNTSQARAEARAVGVDTIFATSCADASKRGFAVVTVSSGASSCTWSRADGVNVYNAFVVNQPFNVTGSCVYQDTPQQMYWYSSDASRFTVVGAPFVCVIGGLGYPCGGTATIRPIFPGTANIFGQAAVQDTTVKFGRTLTAIAAPSSYMAYDGPRSYELPLAIAPPKGAKIDQIIPWNEWVAAHK